MNVLQKTEKLNSYLCLFSRHFKFIDEFYENSMDSEAKKYFIREKT